MPRQPNPHTRVSAYQLEVPLDPRVVLRAAYLDRDEFTTHPVRVGDCDGYMVRGSVISQRARWADVVGTWTGDDSLVANLGNTTAVGVLLLPTNELGHIWALCFGMGFHLIDPNRIVPSLGRRLAARCADPDRLRSITHSRLDSRAYVARTSIPGGDDISGFGASELGDLISRIVGPATLDGLLVGGGGEAVEIRGADAINLPLARESKRLLADLDAIEMLLQREPIPQLATIEQLRALKKSDPYVLDLERALDAALGGTDEPKLGLAWPTELADEAVPLSHFTVTGLARGHADEELRGLTLATLLDPVRALPEGERVRRLDRMRVQAFSDDNEPASSELPARRWLSFEASTSGHRFCMHDGRWYMVDDGLDRRLSERLASIFNAKPSIHDLPPWRAGVDEPAYNRELAGRLGGVCLDRKLIRCESNRRGFESCDVLTSGGVFVHVKAIGRSTGASHLFAQAGVSAQTFLEDPSARASLVAEVEAAGGNPSWVPKTPRHAALVMGNKKVLDADALFSFSRMRLLRLADECKRQQVDLTIVPIAYTM
jgi:uncharacterized protein (TIGR04141 family)